MIKICTECGGQGFITFDVSTTDQDSPYLINQCCDLCQGEGYYKVKSTKLFVKVYDKDGRIFKRLFFDIQNTVNRPNNPEEYEILDTYLLYHYGTDNYECEEMEEVVEIDEDWNIENYR